MHLALSYLAIAYEMLFMNEILDNLPSLGNFIIRTYIHM